MPAIQKKICLLGDFAVGKTSLVRRFIEDRFDDRYLGTIGVKISRKTIARPYGDLNLLIWDMTGGEELGTQTRVAYLRGAAGAIIVCDLTRHETLDVFRRYSQQMRYLNPKTALIFVGNKADLTTGRMISDVELRAICTSLGSERFFVTSAKTGEQVEAAFLHLTEQLEEQA